MRKWIRERVKRRKKAPEKGSAGAPQAPLQPVYFDADPSAPASVESNQGEGEFEPEQSAAEGSGVEPAESSGGPVTPAPQRAGGGGGVAPPARRRRRGRGGRGRGRSGPAAGAASVPAGQAVAGSVAAPAVAVPGAAPASKGVVVLAIGLPGSGKSSWFKRNRINPLSSDMLRELLFDDPTEQRFQDLIFSNLRSMLKARLIARRPTNYVDATNLTPQERSSWIKLGKDYGYEVQAVYFDVPVEVCLQRNQKRERVVSEEVMRRMAAKLKPPTFEEGFGKITVVRVKQKE